MLTLGQQLDRVVRHNGPRTAIRDAAGNLTWQEFGDRVAVAAGMLAALGIGRGARFAIQSRNSARYCELLYAGYRLGAVPVPVNWRLAPPEVAHILSDSAVEAIFLEPDFVPSYRSEELAPWQNQLITLDGVAADVPTYDGLFAKATGAALGETDPDADAIILYTGGTTGRSKGVRLTHGNILSCGAAFGLAVQARPDDTFMHVAPMFHSADLLGTGWISIGAAQVFLPAFTPQAFFEAIRDRQVTATVAVPTMLMMAVTDPALEGAELDSLRLLIFGASPMDPEWIRRTDAAFPGATLCNSYGLTEVAPDLTVFDPADFARAIREDDPAMASVGRPNMFVQLRIVDAEGQDLPTGEVGELWAKGPNITPGYLNLPEATEAAFTDGWFHTGDVARIDERGYVYLLDRKNDMIITGGENVYSAEVEAALYQHPGVHECAVIGVPDERLGEMLMAVIVPAPGAAPEPRALIEHCRGLIGGYKIPRRIEFADTMPKSAMGKILKNALRDQWSDQLSEKAGP